MITDQMIIEKYKKDTIESLEKSVQKIISENPSLNEFEKIEKIKADIAHGVNVYKRYAYTMIGVLELSKREIHSLIDDAANEVLTKYKISNPVPRRNELSQNKGCSVLLASIAILVGIWIIWIT